MSLKIAAISDLHLGAPTSYLTVGSVRKRLFETMKKFSDDGLDLLVLVGDVIDLTVGHAYNPWIAGKEFFAELQESVPIRQRIVYVPGNHDHHLWVLLIESQELLGKLNELGEYGIGTNTNQLQIGKPYVFPTPLHRLFPKKMDEQVAFVYPFFSFEDKRSETRFVFHHGHYFDKAITPLGDFVARNFRDISKIEAFNFPYIEGLFHSCTWDPLVQHLELAAYSKLTEISNSRLLMFFKSILGVDENTSLAGTNLGSCDLAVIDRMMTTAGFRASSSANSVWVFGHTHFCDQKPNNVAPGALQLYNLGGWILNHDPVSKPAGAWSSPAVFFFDGRPWLERIPLLDTEKQSVQSKITPLA